MVYSFFIKCIFFMLTVIPVFAQSGARGQGFLTADPYWRQALGGVVISLPSVQVQSVVVAVDGGNIKAYSTAGTPMWNYSARGRISPFVTRSREGTSYFSRTNGILIAVNRSGRELWRRSIGGPLCAKVVTGWDGRLFVPTDKKIFCYTASGNLLWTKTFESSFTVPPKPDRGGGIIFSLENNEVYRIDPFGNAVAGVSSKTPAVLVSIDEQLQILALYADGTMEIIGSADDWFMSAQAETQVSILPRLPAGPSAAVSRGNNVAAALTNGAVILLSLSEKKILWEGDSHIREFSKNGGKAGTEAEVLFDERGIYVLSMDGASGFSHDGKRLWFTFLQNTTAIPAFDEDGVLYSGGKDWILYSYKIEERSLPPRNSIYGPLPEDSYGTGSPQSKYMRNFPPPENEIKNKLEQIRRGVNTGRVGADEPEWSTFLLAVSSSQQPIQSSVRAINLLGKIGSRETIPWLTNIFRRESDPVIKAAAASAIGAIGVDPEGIAIQTFLFSIIPGNIRDEQVLIAITSATGELCRFSGPPLSGNGIKILNLLSESAQSSIVRINANRELASLR
jgi:outer membrane protein assembly factor BamB